MVRGHLISAHVESCLLIERNNTNSAHLNMEVFSVRNSSISVTIIGVLIKKLIPSYRASV